MKKSKLASLIVTILAAVGVVAVSTASVAWIHQPEVPADLLKK